MKKKSLEDKKQTLLSLINKKVIYMIDLGGDENDIRPEYLEREFMEVAKEFYPDCFIRSFSPNECDPLFIEVRQNGETLAIKFENFICTEARFFNDEDETELAPSEINKEIEQLRMEINDN